jgi:hypothetical protein
MGYSFSVIAFVLGVVVAYLAHGGKRGPPIASSGDWSLLGDRLIAGCICAVFAWFFYELGSQRVTFRGPLLEIVDLLFTWKVARSEVAEVFLTPSSLGIRLSGGTLIEPLMFRASSGGAAMVSHGRFANFSSRRIIAREIDEWRLMPREDDEDAENFEIQSKIRLNPPLLLTLIVLMAVEALIVTALF